jgi:hypothetical protein
MVKRPFARTANLNDGCWLRFFGVAKGFPWNNKVASSAAVAILIRPRLGRHVQPVQNRLRLHQLNLTTPSIVQTVYVSPVFRHNSDAQRRSHYFDSN